MAIFLAFSFCHIYAWFCAANWVQLSFFLQKLNHSVHSINLSLPQFSQNLFSQRATDIFLLLFNWFLYGMEDVVYSCRDVTGVPCVRSTCIAYSMRLLDDSIVAAWSAALYVLKFSLQCFDTGGWRQEGHAACKTLGVGLLVVTI